mmetsp:Transcript_12124/g.28765  ORF Transcript_12124/g.28765 Transcript_12124/m.28765 type:complete len:100 (-) Transcript_12124:995-1294(-)
MLESLSSFHIILTCFSLLFGKRIEFFKSERSHREENRSQRFQNVSSTIGRRKLLLPVLRDIISDTIHLRNPLDEEQLRKKQTQEAPGGWHVQPLKACFG